MRILIDIGHPAQAHFFKNIIRLLEKRGHEVAITLRDRDVAKYLLELYGFNYKIIIDKHYTGLLKKAFGVLLIDYKIYKFAKEFNPDILVAETSYISHVSKAIGKPSILFCNNEDAALENILFLPFADNIVTAKSFQRKFNSKRQIFYNSYFFLSHLHPNYFAPDPTILKRFGLDEDDKFFIIRLRTYDAAHDIGHSNLAEGISQIVDELQNHGRIFIKSDSYLDKSLSKYQLPSIDKFHDLLNFASLYVGDGVTMAAEAALLGTPSVLVSTLNWGYIKDLRDNYGLLYTCKNIDIAKKSISEILSIPNAKSEWQKRREKMLSDKIDVVEFAVDLIESFKSNPKI